MATDRKKIINGIIIGALGLGILGAGIWFFFFRDKCDPNNKGYTKKGKISDKCFAGEKEKDDKDTTPPPATTGCGGKWLADNTFSLKKCMRGDKIRALQTALGFTGTDVDGKFGNDTLGAVQAKFSGRSEVTQSEYNALINPPVIGGALNYENLKKALGSKAIPYSAGVYVDVKGQNKNYVFSFYPEGQFYFSLPKVQASIAQGTYADGGKSMKVNGDLFAYTEDTVFKNMARIVVDRGE